MSKPNRDQLGVFNLAQLSDVPISNPTVDQVVRFNGTAWVNGPQSNVSAGSGVKFYLDDTTILPAGTENAIQVNTLTNFPVTTTEQTDSVSVNNSTAIIEAYLYNTALGRTQLDASEWQLYSYASVSSTAAGASSLITNVYTVPVGSGTLTITGSGTSRTATASLDTPFVSGDANADITLCGYIQTPKGLYPISGYTSGTVVTITVPAGYINESAVSYSVWKLAYPLTTGTLTSTSITLYSPIYAEGAVTTTVTDKLGAIYFGRTARTSATTVSFTHNGNARYSNIKTNLPQLHNSLAGVGAVSATEPDGHLGYGPDTIYGQKTFNDLLTTYASITDKAYTSTTLDNEMILGADPSSYKHGITRLYTTNYTAGFSYFDVNFFNNNAYLYIGRLTNPRAGNYTGQYIYNYILQRNIQFAGAGGNANMLETWNENDLPTNTDLTGTSSTIAMYQRVANGSIRPLGQVTWTIEDTFVSNPVYQSAGVRLYVLQGGSLLAGMYIDKNRNANLYNVLTNASDIVTTSGSYYIGTPSNNTIGSWKQSRTGTSLATTYHLANYEDVSGDGSIYAYVDKFTVDYIGNVAFKRGSSNTVYIDTTVHSSKTCEVGINSIQSGGISQIVFQDIGSSKWYLSSRNTFDTPNYRFSILYYNGSTWPEYFSIQTDGTTTLTNAVSVNNPTLNVVNTANRAMLKITGNTAGEGADKISGGINFVDSNGSGGGSCFITWQNGLSGQPLSFWNNGRKAYFDNVGNLAVEVGNILIPVGQSYYWSTTGGGTNGDARLEYDGTHLYAKRRESGSWVTKATIF